MFFFLLLATILLWGVAPIIEKKGIVNADPFVAVTIRSLGIFAAIAATLLSTGKLKHIMAAGWKTFALFSLSGILAGFLGMLTYFAALKYQPASKVVPLSSTYPLITLILSAVILNEGITPIRILGTILIIGGIWFIK